MDNKLKIGICGCGSISHAHTQAYLKNPNIEIVACCDINLERAKKYASDYHIGAYYGSIDEMLKHEGLEAISVCTWNNSHYECTMKALKANKHVLCEKPMALNAIQAQEMAALAKEKGLILQVGFVKRFAATTKTFQDFQRNGMLGDIYMMKATYLRRVGNPGGWFADKSRSGGGPLIDLGVHVIDLSRYLMCKPMPVSVYGATFNCLGDKNNIKGMNRYHPVDYKPTDKCDVEDNVIALIRFDNGAVLEVEASFTLNIKEGMTKLEAFGTKGGAEVEPNLEFYNDMFDYRTNIQPLIDKAQDLGADMFANEINHFYDCIKNGAECLAPAEDGLILMKILDAIYESARTGHEVIIK